MGKDEDYNYDVFISYHRGEKKIARWVEHIFLSHFKFCLKESLGRNAKVYFDKEEINPGDIWESQLKIALAHTKILVPIWSISYFLSAYCRKEFAVMLHRQEELGYWGDDQKGGLIVLVWVWGKFDLYPEIAQKFQYLECQKYSNLREDSPRLEKFEDDIQQWVPSLAQKIDSVPDCNPEWSQPQWFDDPIKEAEASKTLWPPKEKALYEIPSMGVA